MEQRSTVKEGQRYAQRRTKRFRVPVWKVGSILSSAAIPHARLIDVEDPLHTKTISCATLSDQMYYELVGNSATGIG